ncbi:MAG TPA: hypothetical protein DDW52_18710 [Planctomycetaceae bacterium]|nr:hypothetical protein [Planctomycetaceae bacterium]
MHYDDWINLSNEEQDRIKLHVWDAYKRENIAIPFMALACFIAQSERSILDGAIGTYHGGEYVLHLYVSAAELKYCPQPLTERFEGFRIYWMTRPPR